MEPERKIEKQLRAYAKKRRADAGDSLKLHPATRRLLQAEVARNQPKPDAAADRTLWDSFRRQWAFLAGFAVLVLLVAALFLPGLSSAKKKSPSATAMNNLKQIGVAAQMAAGENHGRLPASLDALTNQLGSDKPLTDAESGQRYRYLAGGENLDALPSNAVLAYAPTDKTEREVLFADGRVEMVKSDRLSELTNHGLAPLIAVNAPARRQLLEIPAEQQVASANAAVAPPGSAPLKSEADRKASKLADLGGVARSTGKLATVTPAASATRLEPLANEADAASKDFATQTSSVQFASTVSLNAAFGLQNSFKNTVTPTHVAPVLANFQVQQNGNAIRVVDADGSVYDGALLAEAAVAPDASAPAQKMKQAKTIASQNEPEPAQNNFFRVRGLNQTLKQNVVFTGNLLATSETAKHQQPSFSDASSGGGQPQSALTKQLPWSSSRIAGMAVVADTNRLEIDAVPLAP